MTKDDEGSVSDIRAVIPPEPKGGSDSSITKFAILFVVIALIISVIAIIISATSLARNATPSVIVNTDGSSSSAGSTDAQTGASSSGEIWTFAIGHDGTNIEYIDDVSGTLRGFHVDIVDAVCSQANKDCRLIWDVYENCWNSQAGQRARGGAGLLGRWYDACTGWFNTYERALTVQFTSEFRQGLSGTFYVRSANPGNFDATNIRAGNKIGFIDGWASDEHCLARSSIQGVPLQESQVIHYGTRELLLAAVNSGEVAAAFANTNVYAGGELEAVGDPVTTCVIGGGSMMARKDSTINDWWNPAFEQIKNTAVYRDVCNKVTTDHGHQPGASGDLLCVD